MNKLPYDIDYSETINIDLFKEVYDFLYTDEDKSFHQPSYPLLEMQYDILRFQERIGQLMDREFHEGVCLDRPESEGGNQYSSLYQVYETEFIRLGKLADRFMDEVVKPFNYIESNIRHDYYHGVH